MLCAQQRQYHLQYSSAYSFECFR
ncbi:hypothetical protein A3Q56_02573 [Intoshia linei]|uniref:Uncharacterized protein n=1 Tax=Intoshia linei TaxID=1819745 RepID=A0A177B607_9BILA|nr:hypothetical protein A3Q56_02573 [Intoshia linei]